MNEMILKGCKDIPLPSLLKYVEKGDVTIEALEEAGLQPEKLTYLRTMLLNADHTAWNNAVDENTPASYYRYLEKYPDGVHAGEATAQIYALEEYYWDIAYTAMDFDGLRNYLSMYPTGIHADECNAILEDSEWANVCRRDTIASYRDYQARYPNRFTEFIEERVYALQDQLDWDNACQMGTTDAYNYYVAMHPDGQYVQQAYSRIQANAGREAFLGEIAADLNAVSAEEIQKSVENGVASWNDLEPIFGYDRTLAIHDFRAPTVLPTSTPSPQLQDNSTEVYFWGTPSSGKTCALGSIISNARRQGIFEGLECPGYDYMTRLSNLFDSRGYASLPDSTSIGNIQEMILNLRDPKGKRHKVTLIDLAGELFRSVYFKLSGRMVNYEAENVLNTALNYLVDNRNNKMHFFVVEYGAHAREWEGLGMADYLEKMIQFLKEQKVMRKTTVGVYVLVTKCDLIPCAPPDRPRMAYEYVVNQLGNFWNMLQDACVEGGVKDVRVLSFSIGDVFARNLCQFDSRDCDKVINKLITKTHGVGGAFNSFLNVFRS